MHLRLLAYFTLIVAFASAASTVCVDAEVIETKTYKAKEGELKVYTTTCKQPARIPANATLSDHSAEQPALVKRPVSECTVPNECFCGSTCVTPITCYASPGLILPSDCTALNSAIKAQLKGSFFVPPHTSQRVALGSCEFVYTNAFPVETIEYCWDDFAAYGLAMSTICPVQEAECLGAASLWYLDLLYN